MSFVTELISKDFYIYLFMPYIHFKEQISFKFQDQIFILTRQHISECFFYLSFSFNLEFDALEK